MITASQKRLPRRGAEGGRMETRVPDPLRRKLLEGRRVARATERARRTVPRIVDKHDEYIRRARWWPYLSDRGILSIRILRVISCQTKLWPIGDWKNTAGDLVWRVEAR